MRCVPTIALFRCTCSPVTLATSRLAGTRRLVLIAGIEVIDVAARAHRHDDFFQRAIAGSFPNAVDRTLNLTSAICDGRQTVRLRPAPDRYGNGY